MFKRLINKIGYWMIDGQDRYEPVEVNHTKSISRSTGSSRSIDGNSMNFNVFSASGGKIVQFQTYDPVKDRSNTRLYIIKDGDNLGEELAQIITLESLSN